MKLDVGVGRALRRSHEAERVEMIAGSDARLEKQPSCTHKGFSQQRSVRIERDGFQTFVLQVNFQVVLQMFSDGIERMNAGDVGIFQTSGVADS